LKYRLTYCHNRLMEGLYTGTLAEGISTTMYNGTQGYDKNGNIGYLKRTTGGGATVMDELIYSYTANQLTAVTDGGDVTKGFKDKVNAIDYTYDQAGNMITDANKDLSIAYNHLNLPASITRNTIGGSTNGIVKHFYAGATKVRMETYDAAGTTLVKAYDYLAGMVYQETVTAGTSTKELDFVASPEGRALLTKKVLNLTTDPTTGDKFKFEYSLKDHLGNLRVSCRCGEPKRDAQGVIIPTGQPGAGIEPLAVVQEQHYDAWGLAFTTVSSSEVENLQDRFKYNGKELLTDLDLGWNDYGARMYMSEIGRWNGVDPHADNYFSSSSYCYVDNSPLYSIDPDGKDIIILNVNKQNEKGRAGYHLAALIGDDLHGWYYYSKDGTVDNPWYSMKPKNSQIFFRKLNHFYTARSTQRNEYFEKLNIYRSEFRIKTTREQDLKAIKEMKEQIYDWNNLYLNNCGDAVGCSLEAAGLDGGRNKIEISKHVKISLWRPYQTDNLFNNIISNNTGSQNQYREYPEKTEQKKKEKSEEGQLGH
jgi:RHS repeat-associated protein